MKIPLVEIKPSNPSISYRQNSVERNSILRIYIMVNFEQSLKKQLKMDIKEYWIGENVNPLSAWEAYDRGLGYVNKFRNTSIYVMQITFVAPPKDLPLFNMEAVYKTLKSYYYEMKRLALSPQEFNVLAPWQR